MPYPSDLTDDHWALLEPVFKASGKRGRKHADDLRTVVDAMLYIAQTGCQWRYLRRRSDHGRGSGRSSGAGRATARGRGPSPCCTLPHAKQTGGPCLPRQGVTDRLELVLVDRGVTAAAARTLGRDHELEVRRVGWDDKQPVFRPIRHAWRVEVAHGRLGRSGRLAKSFENTTSSATGWLQVACIATTLRHLSREQARRRPATLAA
jgi:transposase